MGEIPPDTATHRVYMPDSTNDYKEITMLNKTFTLNLSQEQYYLVIDTLKDAHDLKQDHLADVPEDFDAETKQLQVDEINFLVDALDQLSKQR